MAQSAANFGYQDFDPFHEWSQDEGSVTLIVKLPGFLKEQLRVQVTSTLVLRINGERQVFENKRSRFAKEFSIPPYCDTDDVSAKFEGGVLTIKFPKLITPSRPQPQQAPMPQKEKESAQQDQVDKQESPQKEKEPTSDEKEESSPQKENEPISDDKEKDNKTKEKMAPKEVAQKKVRTNGVPETAQEGTTSKPELIQRLKTRVLDFTVSLRSVEDQDVKQGDHNQCSKLIKRPKIWMNIFVVILLVMVLGLYVKNAFKSSQGGSKFNEFKEF